MATFIFTGHSNISRCINVYKRRTKIIVLLFCICLFVIIAILIIYYVKLDVFIIKYWGFFLVISPPFLYNLNLDIFKCLIYMV
jgi:hypothetical protein